MATIAPYALTSTQRIKDLLQLTSGYNASALDAIKSIINAISRHSHRICKRNIDDGKYLKMATYTEYYNGDATNILLTNQFPIISVTSLHNDPDRNFTSTELLTEGLTSDFIIENPNAGIIRNLKGVFTRGLSNLKLVYKAGYSQFDIVTGENDQLIFKEVSGGSNITATLTANRYNGDTLATEIKTQLDAAGGTPVYTVTYSTTTHKLTIASSGSYFEFLTTSGASKELALLTGFDTAAVVSDAVSPISIASDEPIVAIPDDLQLAVDELTLWTFKLIDKDRLGVVSESRGESSFSYDFRGIPENIKELFSNFVKRRF